MAPVARSVCMRIVQWETGSGSHARLALPIMTENDEQHSHGERSTWPAPEQTADLICALLEVSDTAVVVMDPTLCIVRGNPAWRAMFALDESAAAGQNLSDFVPEPAAGEILAAARTRAGWSGEFDTAGSDRAIFRAKGRTVVVRGRAGAPTQIVAAFTDISAYEKMQAALVREKEHLRQAQAIAQAGSWELDLRTNELLWSDEIYVIFEIDPERFGASYEAFLQAVHPEDRDKVNAAYLNSLADRTAYEITHRLLMADGRIKYVNERGQTQYDRDGQPLISTGTVQDISTLYAAQMELMQLSDLLEGQVAARTSQLLAERNFTSAVLDAQGVLVVVCDVKGRAVRTNRAFSELTGLRAEELNGMNIWERVVSPTERAEGLQSLRDLFAHGGAAGLENHWETGAGEECLIAWTNTTIRGAEGQVEYAICTGLDITEQRQAERALELAKEEAERANRSKSEFLAIMNHELRTPLTSIISAATLIGSTGERNLQPEMLRIIGDSAEHLLNLVNDILTLSAVEAGAASAERVRFDLSDLVESVVATCAQSYSQAPVTARVDIALDVPNHVWGDAVRLRQILLNLLSNAFKFTELGEVSVVVRWLDLYAGIISFTVSDTGPGIPPEKHATIFEPFAMVNMGRGRRFAGTGLGLALVRRLVGLLGGTVELQSAAGHGTTFRLVLPLEPCGLWLHGRRFGRACALCSKNVALPLWTSRLEDRVKHMRVLLVEDNPVNAGLFRQIFAREGFAALFSAASGKEALEVFQLSRPEIVFLDLHLPDTDGFQVVAAMRQRLEPGHQPLFVALTADAAPGVRELCIAKGMHDYITKPIAMEVIRAVLHKHFGPGGIGPE